MIYFDHAATTAVAPKVLDAMLPYFSANYGNPSSIYSAARQTRRALDDARDSVAASLGARSAEIIFTSGGTESDNLAIKGVALAARARLGASATPLVITTQIEHHAVLHTVDFLERLGFRAVRLPVDSLGTVDLGALADALAGRYPGTAGTTPVIVSVMYANNEIGTIEPIREVVRIVKEHDQALPVHTDAVQAAGALDLSVGEPGGNGLGVDLLSISAHKFAGPKGSGALFVRRGTSYWPQQQGGAQERGRRAGTENVPGIVGLAAALRLADAGRLATNERVRQLREELIRGVLAAIPDAILTGHPTERLPNSASFCFPGVEGESLLIALDQADVLASSGSACTSASLEASHVLLALGLPPALAHGSLRLTLGPENTAAEVARFLALLPEIFARLRA